MVEKDVQKRILKSLYNNGGKATTKEIAELSGLSEMSVGVGCKHLYSRALISKKIKKTIAKQHYPPHKIATWRLNENLLPKIKFLISQIGQDVE